MFKVRSSSEVCRLSRLANRRAIAKVSNMAALEQERVVQDIEKLSRDWAAVKRGDSREVSLEEVVRSLNILRAKLAGFRQRVLPLYNAAKLLTDRAMSTAGAVKAWEDLHYNYSVVLQRWIRMPKIEPEIDAVIEELRPILSDLEAKSDQQYRSYKETEHLLSSPANTQGLQDSIKEAESGELPVFESFKD